MNPRSLFFRFAAVALLTPVALQAHPGHGPMETSFGFSAGVAHPFSGWDHLLAMVAIGLWAAQQKDRLRWLIPAAFVAMMVVGGMLGQTGIAHTGVEQGIAASLLVVGLLVAFAAQLPVLGGAALVGLFGLFHGVAHTAEMPASVSTLGYSLGFVATTVLLHALGMGLGFITQRGFGGVTRAAGCAVVVTGALMLVA